MKIRNITFVALVLVTIFSLCGCDLIDKINNGTSETDSVSADETSLYLSPDLAAYNLKGNVKGVQNKLMVCDEDGNITGEAEFGNYTLKFNRAHLILEGEFEDKYFYDKDGNFKDEREDSAYISRNEKGQVTSYHYCKHRNCVDYDPDNDWDFTYDKLGRFDVLEYCGWEWGGTDTYSYYDDGTEYAGECVHLLSNWYDEGMYGRIDFYYDDYEFDEYGNWTSRSVVRKSQDDEEGNEDGPTVYDDEYYKEVRKIIYFE